MYSVGSEKARSAYYNGALGLMNLLGIFFEMLVTKVFSPLVGQQKSLQVAVGMLHGNISQDSHSGTSVKSI